MTKFPPTSNLSEKELVAKIASRFKRQYYDARKRKWDTFGFWEIQPELLHLLLTELQTLKAVDVLLDESWTRHLRRKRK